MVVPLPVAIDERQQTHCANLLRERCDRSGLIALRLGEHSLADEIRTRRDMKLSIHRDDRETSLERAINDFRRMDYVARALDDQLRLVDEVVKRIRQTLAVWELCD